MRIPRPEYPRPQFQRSDWLSLNGKWSYEFDFGCSGMDNGRRLYQSRGFASIIIVPFCPESELSGVGHKDFIPAMWYHRAIEIPKDWRGRRVMLNFGAVDYECEAFIDGTSVGIHFGGSCSFSFDITAVAHPGVRHDLVVRVADDTRNGHQPGGKQSHKFESFGCHYTRTTGIWQTVWLEAVAQEGLNNIQILPDLDGKRLIIIPCFHEVKKGNVLRAVLKEGKKNVSETSVGAANGIPLVLQLDAPRPWSQRAPFLYGLELRVLDANGKTVDTVESYCGIRKIHIEGDRVFLNNEPLYQRLVLDQGFYPDGIWTAPSDDALRHDIELALRAGFNGARLHQKVFEERFHYWADRLGYLTWGESASWGCNCNSIDGARNFLGEWGDIIVRDRNHPSIITWTPWNETGTTNNRPNKQHGRLLRDSYRLCKQLDPTRPVNDASGYIHFNTDIWTVHNYNQDPGALAKTLRKSPDGSVWRNFPDLEAQYSGQPYVVDEYGGIKWVPKQRRSDTTAWGYGDAPKTMLEFMLRLEALTDAILAQKHISGFCYTQLTDVEQEQNGIYNYDRSDKFDMKKINSIFSKSPFPQ